MTPHDELMALAGKATPGEWKSDASVHPDDVSVWACAPGSEEFVNNVCFDNAEADAAFIAAACNFVRSDAFRAMVRDAGLGRYVAQQMIERGPIKTVSGQDVYCVMLPAVPRDAGADAAIDAAASGAGEVKP